MSCTIKMSQFGLRTLWIFLCVASCLNLGWAQWETPPASYHVFPRFVAFGTVSSGLALFNPSSRPATVVLILAGSDGAPIADVTSPLTLTVPAKGQKALVAGELFGTEVPLDASLTVASLTPGIVAVYQTFDFDATYMDGTDAPQPDQSLVFPVIPGSQEGAAEIDLLNTNPRPTAVELKLWSLSGDMLAKASVQVPAGGFYRNLADSVFPSGTLFTSASHITATSKPSNTFTQAQAVSGTSLLAGFGSYASPEGFIDIAALNALSLTETYTSGALPYFRTGAQVSSTLALTNVEPAAIDVTVTAIANDGATLGTRKISLKSNGGYRAPLQSVFPSFSGTDKEGWLLVQSTGRVAASVLYGRTNMPSLSAISLQKVPRTEFVFPQVVQSSGFHTEITLVNPSSSPSRLELFVVRPDGVTVAAGEMTLARGARVSQRLNQLLPEFRDFGGGYCYVRASEPLFAAASVWSDTGETLAAFGPENAPSYYAPAPLTQFAVTGTVRLNGRPAPGFRVALSGPVGQLATSDSEGYYAFTGLPAGRYSMAIEQFGFQFVPNQVNFELTTSSKRQDFVGSTEPNAIVVQPAAISARSGATAATIFGTNFNSTSQAWAGSARIQTTFVDETRLLVTIPAYLLAEPSSFEIIVVTNGDSPDRRVSQPYPIMVYVSRPILSEVIAPEDLVEGSPGASLILRGAGFLAGARVKVNGVSDEIQITPVSAQELVAYVPSRYFRQGGIYPVTVVNPYPANVESNIQLLTVFYPAPAAQEISPQAVAARLEPGSASLSLEVMGYGFRRGAVIYFEGIPLATTYCESDAFCLSVHLYAKVPADYLKNAGYAEIVVRNPDPSLAPSEKLFLRIDGLEPTVTSVMPGSATTLDLPGEYRMPVLVYGTNLGPQTQVRVYKAGTEPPPEFSDSKLTLVSSTQLVVEIDIEYAEALGEWLVEVMNPQPGGGISEPVSFYLSEGNFAGNPFLLMLTPAVVAAGGPGFPLTINGVNFKSGSQIRFNSTLVDTIVVSERQVRAEIPADLIRYAGRFPISVTNPDTGGTSNRLYLDVR